MTDHALSAHKVTVRLGRGAAPTLDRVSLDVPSHEQHTVVGLAGPNGCGKTTLLRTLIGATAAESGEVLHDLNLAAHYCDVIHVMNEGRIVASGAPSEVLTPEILEPIYGIDIEVVEIKGRLHLLFGQAPALTKEGLLP